MAFLHISFDKVAVRAQFELQFELQQRMHSLSGDDTLDLLKDFLPDIEQQLRNQLEPDIEEQYQTRIQAQLQRIERQAQQQFQEALATLQQQFEQLKTEKEHELQKELQKQQQSFEEKEKVRLATAQEKFLQDHFDDRIMTHQAMTEVEEALEAEIAEMLFHKYSAVREKKLKELRVRLQSREQKERLQADKVIRNDIYAKSGLQELKEDLHKYKIAIAAQKSQYNVNISKVAAEVKALEKKCKQIEYGNSDLLIQQMQQQIDQLQRQFTLNQSSQQTSSLQDSQLQQQITVDFGGNFSKNKHFGINNNNKLNGSLGDAQYISEDIELDSDEDSLNESNSRQLPSLPPPPMTHGEVLSRLMHERSRYQSQPQEVILQMPTRPVLQWDVGKMLRQQWEEDSFDRYLSQRNDKENCSNNANQDSNFQSLYTEHLKKLNRDSRVPKMRKLSERAKQQVLAHYGSHRNPREENY